MNICLCPRRMRREGCPGLVMWLRSPGDIQSAMEVPCLHSGIYAQPGTMTNFSFSTLLTVLTLSLGSWGERLLCLKEQHLSLGNFVCVCGGELFYCVCFFAREEQSFLFLGRQTVPSGVHPSSTHPPDTRRAPPAFSSLYLPHPSFLTKGRSKAFIKYF